MEKIAIVGMGKMGSAIETRIKHEYDVTPVRREDPLELLEGQDLVILTVKPQIFTGDRDKNIKGLGENLWMHDTGQLFLSFMAGVPIMRLAQMLGTRRVARAMTTLAVANGEGNTVWFSRDKTVDTQALDTLLGKLGRSERVADEALVNSFTGIFGSGPGYLYKFLGYLEQQAVERGFSAQQAREMTNQMLRGAASQLDPAVSFEEQAARVASRGGTTEAGFTVFENRGLEDIVGEAVGAACLRADELGKA